MGGKVHQDKVARSLAGSSCTAVASQQKPERPKLRVFNATNKIISVGDQQVTALVTCPLLSGTEHFRQERRKHCCWP